MIPTRKALVPIVESGRVIGDMPVEMSEQCATCKRWTEAMRCEAFSEGIPDAIWTGRHDHTQPFSGDGGLLYDSIEGVQDG